MAEHDQTALLAAAKDAVLARFPEAFAIYVYGSRATGKPARHSDLDLALLLPHDAAAWDKLTVTDELSRALGVEVDVVDLDRASDVLRHEVLETGQLLYARDPDRLLAWEGTAITRYQRHREEVREILEDFARTGTGYRG